MNNAESAFELWARKEGWVPSHRGWPDYLCRRGAEVMCVEVKDGNDWLSGEQRAVLVDLHALGLPTFVWTPRERLMAYPKIQDDSLLTRLELAYELEQAREELKRVTTELEIARTQLAPSVQRMNDMEVTYRHRLERAGANVERLAMFVIESPDAPENLVKQARQWRSGWSRHRMQKPFDGVSAEDLVIP